MSTNSNLSSGPPLYYCGVLAPVRNSWTTSNAGRKWYGCMKYKVIFEISFVLYFIVSSLWHSCLFLFHAESQ
jgi:hypothetical protein